MTFSCLRVILLCAAVLFPGASYAASDDVRILDAEFGVFKAGPDGEVIFESARVVPRRAGQRYGWAIEVHTKKRRLNVREEYVQAEPPSVPETAAALDFVMPPKRRPISQRQLVPVDGWIYGEWTMSADEAAGPRRLHVLVETLPPVEFVFEVSDSPP
ncbi:hypothetical protein [Propionivibrio limicola]|uniref:hypothetical protein n=1 Tax=Propionivibrio limicola TaxID=167645 RepID=UPI00129097D2|nr:hypothetical protein [Propionivibrio limicola]